jgi:hypothetical protein
MEAQETGKADLVVDVHQTSYGYSSWFEIGGEAALYRRCVNTAGIRPDPVGRIWGPGLYFLVLLCKAHILCPRYSLPPR